MYKVMPVEYMFHVWCDMIAKNKDDQFVLLDTETTDLRGEVIDLSIISPAGDILYDGFLKPVGAISPKAQAIHHITEAMVHNAPTIEDEWSKLQSILSGKKIITYNAPFDAHIIYSSAKRYGCDVDSNELIYQCAMREYAEYWNAPPNGGFSSPAWQSLGVACHQQNVVLTAKSHRALADVQATLALVRKIAEVGTGAPTYHTRVAQPMVQNSNQVL